MWGTDKIGIRDEESWFDAVKKSKHMKVGGSWYTLEMPNGYTKKFQPSRWAKLIDSDEEFKKNILELIDIEVVQKFHNRDEKASNFYENEE